MKVHDIINEDGKIVPGVNTTVDVKPGETERQAKKFFGGSGKPKPLGVKGASPNQAYNLGLVKEAAVTFYENISHTAKRVRDTEKKRDVKIGSEEWFKLWFSLPYLKEGVLSEAYKMQLERADDMYILHILDTKTNQRTEVRGSKGYESGGYDSDDRLHKLLDVIGKSANISELMNGEVVTINPKHPDGKNAKAHADKAFNEAEIAMHKGNTKIGKNIDLSKSADGTFWLASPTADWSNIVRTGDTVDNAYEISSKAKLATWDDIDRYGTGELEAMGYDGVRMPDGDDHITYQIWNTKILKPIDLNEAAELDAQDREEDIKYGKQFNEVRIRQGSIFG